MLQSRTIISIQDFDRFVAQPENAGRRFEYIAGRVVEVTSNTYASALAMRIASMLFAYLTTNDICYVTGSDGGYMLSGERYIPDVGFIAYTTQPEIATTGYNSRPPDFAIEVISNPSNVQEHEDLRRKISNNLAAGTIVWVFDWQKEQAEAHTPGKPMDAYEKEDVIDGGDLLPGFMLSLEKVYAIKPGQKG